MAGDVGFLSEFGGDRGDDHLIRLQMRREGIEREVGDKFGGQPMLASEIGEQVTVVSVDPGDMRTRMHQEAFPGQDVSDRPLPEVTEPFWRWLFDQDPEDVRAQRFVAQQEDVRWHQPA